MQHLCWQQMDPADHVDGLPWTRSFLDDLKLLSFAFPSPIFHEFSNIWRVSCGIILCYICELISHIMWLIMQQSWPTNPISSQYFTEKIFIFEPFPTFSMVGFNFDHGGRRCIRPILEKYQSGKSKDIHVNFIKILFC